MSGSSAIVLSNRSYPTPTVASNFAKNPFDWETLSTLSSMPTGGSISRSGNAMLYDSTGKLTYAPNNLLLNSATLSTQSVTTAAINYILSFKGTGSVALSGAYTGNLAGTGAANRVSLAFTSTAASLTLTVTGSVTEAQLEAVTYQTTPSTYVATTSAAYYGPRFDYNPSTLAAKGLLIEGTRTNLCVQSQNITTTWAKATAGDSVSATAATSPTGETNGNSFTADGTSSPHFVYTTSNGFAANTVQTWSVYLKNPPSNAANFVYIDNYFSGATNGYISQIVNLTNGTLSQISVGSSASVISTQIQNIGNGWYRVSITGTINGTGAPVFAVGIAAAATGNTFDGFGRVNSFATSASFYMFGAQVEQASFPSSYIPTVASSVTRAAETFAITGYSSNLIEAYYTDEATGNAYSANYNAGVAPSTSFGWTTALRVYTNAYAGDIATPSWIDNSGTTGNRMVTDSTGALTWAPANMLTYSQDVTNAAWNKTFVTASTSGIAPDGTSTASLVAETTANNVHFTHTSNVVFSVGDVCLASVYFKKGNGATAPNIIQLCLNSAFASTNYANFNISSGTVTASSGLTANIVDAGNGWWRCSVYSTATSAITAYGLLIAFTNDNATATRGSTYTGVTTSNVYIWGAQLERVTYQTSPRAYIPTTTAAVYQPRYDYDASTVPATPRGMLIEESRANLLTYSQTLATAWTDTNITRVSTTRTSPDGTGNALEVSASAANGTIIRNAAVGSSAARTLSIWLKRVSGTGNIQYTLDNGSTWTTQAITLDWVRYTFASTTANQQVGFRIVNSGDIIQIWGAQLETGSFATSYIPTTTASVTRVADVVKLSGSALTTAGAATGSAIVQTAAWLNSTSAARDLLSSATTRRLLYSNNSNTVLSSTDGTTGLNATIGGSGTFTGGAVRSAIAWNASGRSLVANNGTLTSDAVSLSTGATATLGGYGTTTTFDGWVASLALYSQKLPDAILKQKSSVGAPY